LLGTIMLEWKDLEVWKEAHQILNHQSPVPNVANLNLGL